jgi:polyferredoxin
MVCGVVTIISAVTLTGIEGVEMRRVASAIAVLCIVLGSLIAIALVVKFVGALLRGDFSPWWMWLVGILAVGILGIAAGSLLSAERKE